MNRRRHEIFSPSFPNCTHHPSHTARCASNNNYTKDAYKDWPLMPHRKVRLLPCFTDCVQPSLCSRFLSACIPRRNIETSRSKSHVLKKMSASQRTPSISQHGKERLFEIRLCPSESVNGLCFTMLETALEICFPPVNREDENHFAEKFPNAAQTSATGGRHRTSRLLNCLLSVCGICLLCFLPAV